MYACFSLLGFKAYQPELFYASFENATRVPEISFNSRKISFAQCNSSRQGRLLRLLPPKRPPRPPNADNNKGCLAYYSHNRKPTSFLHQWGFQALREKAFMVAVVLPSRKFVSATEQIQTNTVKWIVFFSALQKRALTSLQLAPYGALHFFAVLGRHSAFSATFKCSFA